MYNPFEMTDEEFIAILKGRGLNDQTAWNQYIIELSLKPRIDFKAFRKIYSKVAPVRLIPTVVYKAYTHLITYNDNHQLAVQVIEETDDYVKWIHESGMTGTDHKNNCTVDKIQRSQEYT